MAPMFETFFPETDSLPRLGGIPEKTAWFLKGEEACAACLLGGDGFLRPVDGGGNSKKRFDRL